MLVGWAAPFASSLVWTGLVLCALGIPAFLPFLTGLVPRRLGIAKRSHLRAVGRDLVLGASHLALAVTLLAHQAWLMSDAIARSLVRLYVTRRVTAAQAKAGVGFTLGASIAA